MYPFVFKNRDPARTRRCLQMLDIMTRFAWLPGVQLHPWLNPDETDMRWLPINEDIRIEGDMPMPVTILDRLIAEASHRMVYDYCGCRLGYECKDYPIDIGCLLLGDAAVGANPGFCREVTVAEAGEHARKAVDAGLVPFVGKVRLDNALFGIKDKAHLLSVCFCCECCCVTRCIRRVPLKYLDRMVRPLDGVGIEVTGECTGCGACAEHCYMKAIDIIDGVARIGPLCRACGRCASVCPSDAIEVSLEDAEFVKKAIERIREHVDYR